MAAVFFTLILLTGNTMAQAVRERIPELAILKTIGFTSGSVLGLLLAEADPAVAARRRDRACCSPACVANGLQLSMGITLPPIVSARGRVAALAGADAADRRARRRDAGLPRAASARRRRAGGTLGNRHEHARQSMDAPARPGSASGPW